MRKLTIFFFSLALSGCASFYDVKPDQPVQAYVKPKAIDQNFDISGRFNVKQPDQSSYGNFSWVKQGDNEVLSFKTPLGQTVAQITIESGIPTLTKDGETYTGDDFDDVMDENLGFTMPMNYLHFWIQGVPVPNEPVTKQLHDGFVQLGWNVEYLQWKDSNHPQIIQCTKNNLVLKLLIEW